MPGTILIGAQWGDEGKGKATDLLADKMDVVVRYQGGNNAGHTVVVGGRTFRLHLVPSGILHPHITTLIGDGVVVDPGVLLVELAALEAQGISTANLKVSANAHLIMPWHKERDKLAERYLGSNKIGTTGRGIGPAYGDKVARLGIRVQDLLEGAQATMLDVDHGTYPFVTSSSPVSGGALAGADVGPGEIQGVIGLAKAYTTRVGSGPLPTEAAGPEAAILGRQGAEFGTTTGRPRRCGWLDTVVLRYAARLNGLTELFLSKLDVLSSFDRIPVATAYRIDGEVTEDWPMTQTEVHHAEPVYEYFDGWRDDITGVTRFEDLPRAARTYVEAVEKLSGVPVTAVFVGPGREQTLLREPAGDGRGTAVGGAAAAGGATAVGKSGKG